ncbi:hypothetical protein [Ramlibacter alkalitolerans]|uniref:DUF998 domain-containing protein n=1 Tax=Ramlibacter alkalitolerans TaxID=2039631 RepID=A0ABS1JMC5_9BURK|nr:hypothetical protein [Ramlibacter alkalitolerans]MBL0425390.1 hypothetical protein [Ramlibacter alkalitolerans]
MSLPSPGRREIDHRTIKLLVGLIAITLPLLTSALSPSPLGSISASYYEGGWPQSIFTGFLFAIAAFLLAYNGYSRREMALSKTAAAAALGIALFPCKCGTHTELVPGVHAISAAVMFVILAFLCHEFRLRALVKGYPEAKLRAHIYVACGSVIAICIAVLALDSFSGGALSARAPRLTFYGEAAALLAFGVSWLTASRVLPGLTTQGERFSPLKESAPD